MFVLEQEQLLILLIEQRQQKPEDTDEDIDKEEYSNIPVLNTTDSHSVLEYNTDEEVENDEYSYHTQVVSTFLDQVQRTLKHKEVMVNTEGK